MTRTHLPGHEWAPGRPSGAVGRRLRVARTRIQDRATARATITTRKSVNETPTDQPVSEFGPGVGVAVVDGAVELMGAPRDGMTPGSRAESQQTSGPLGSLGREVV